MPDFQGKVNITDNDGNTKITLDGETGQIGIGVTPHAQIHLEDAVFVASPEKRRLAAYDEFVAFSGTYDYQYWTGTQHSNRELRIQSASSTFENAEGLQYGGYSQYILYNGRITQIQPNTNANLDVTVTQGLYGRFSGVEFQQEGNIHILSSGPIPAKPSLIHYSDGKEQDITPIRRLSILHNGNVGIGTQTPTEALEVHGNIFAKGDVLLEGADCAEEFGVEDTALIDPGTVMVIGDQDKLRQCMDAYDKRVAGVISGAGEYKPGIILDRQQSSSPRVPLALMGKVFCKVDASFGSIEVGDLLTTAPTPGHAMKVHDPFKAFGAIIGKALRPLTAGQGLIPILVRQQ